MPPRSIRNDASFRIAHRLGTCNHHITHRRLEHARQFGIHVSALGHLICADFVYEAVLSIPVYDYLPWMRRVCCGFILEVDVVRRNEDKARISVTITS